DDQRAVLVARQPAAGVRQQYRPAAVAVEWFVVSSIRVYAMFGPCVHPRSRQGDRMSPNGRAAEAAPRTLLGRFRAAVRAPHYSPRTAARDVGGGDPIVAC